MFKKPKYGDKISNIITFFIKNANFVVSESILQNKLCCSEVHNEWHLRFLTLNNIIDHIKHKITWFTKILKKKKLASLVFIFSFYIFNYENYQKPVFFVIFSVFKILNIKVIFTNLCTKLLKTAR